MKPGSPVASVQQRQPTARRRAVTQARVLDAADRLFLEKGYRATSVQEIAAAAGYTTGAIYSNFTGKDDLFLAVLRRRVERQGQVWREALETVVAVEDVAEAMGSGLARAIQEPAWYAVMFEFLSYAARDEHLSRAAAATYYDDVEVLWEEFLRRVAGSSPLPLHRLAPIVLAVMRGLALGWFLEPEAVDTTLFADAVRVLLGGGQHQHASNQPTTGVQEGLEQ
jgi:AcrR family transcriptional regulator